MAKVFEDVLTRGMAAGYLPGKTKEAREWYRNTAKGLGRMNETALLKSANRDQFENKLRIGHMYMFVYDPKHKATLPYYDRFPLIFPIDKAKGGFLGINFHYLPLPLRAKLMDALYDVTSNKKMDDTTKLRVSYGILKSATKYNMFKPAIKHYLTDHLKTRPLRIEPRFWDVSLFMPVEKFVGATKKQVFADSKNIIQGKKPMNRNP